MRQNGTNGVTPTRRIVLGGGLSAALWRLGAHARVDTPAPAAQGILDFEAAPARLQVAPAPAQPVAAYAYVPRGQPAVFALANKTAVVQAMRLWGHVARLLHSMDDGWEPYWRDTILIQPGRTAHVAFVADNPGKWPLESAIPEHRAAGVGTWFQVG
jgi:hypothetical protein